MSHSAKCFERSVRLERSYINASSSILFVVTFISLKHKFDFFFYSFLTENSSEVGHARKSLGTKAKASCRSLRY